MKREKKRDTVILIRLSKEEKENWVKLALKHDRSLSSIIRFIMNAVVEGKVEVKN